MLTHKPSRSRYVVIGAAVVAITLAGGGWILGSGLHRVDPQVSGNPGDTTSPPADVDARLSALESNLARIEASIGALADARALGQGSAHDAGAVTADTALAFDMGAMQAQRDKTRAEYAAAFRSEAIDASWAPATQSDLLEKVASDHQLASAIGGPETFDVQCRSTMCEMTFEFADEGVAADWAEAYLADVGSSAGRVWSASVSRPDGSTTVVMYGFRPK